MAQHATEALIAMEHQYIKGSFSDMELLYLNGTLRDTIAFTLSEAATKDTHYTLFRWEDWPAWATFTAAFCVLITFDFAWWNRNASAMTLKGALMYTLFWVACACGFCSWVYAYYGPNQAFMWMSGYMLEWMLSFDNLFVFHMIFSAYATPDYLKHRPLYMGICGAVIFRLVFIFVGEYLMHSMVVFHFIFGGFLVYTGLKTATTDDDDDDPTKQPIVQWLQRRVPFVGAYDEKGAFFVKVPVDAYGEAMIPNSARQGTASETSSLTAPQEDRGAQSYGTVDFSGKLAWASSLPNQRYQLRATMLFLVVICLEISDLLFAVDSVSAIVAQVNDLFLAYTSAVFAMLGLRASFFVVDVLAKLFTLLKYGVSLVLVFIGLKLMFSRFYYLHPGIVCALLFFTIASSMVASVIYDRMSGDSEKEKDEAEAAGPSA